jgi:hypothetical protein
MRPRRPPRHVRLRRHRRQVRRLSRPRTPLLGRRPVRRRLVRRSRRPRPPLLGHHPVRRLRHHRLLLLVHRQPRCHHRLRYRLGRLCPMRPL